ncbi:MarR family winged helix-turn-helix transcriptional regulator [Leifsonia aquatica]|uniref:MarR family winged helix-turn-helix transcriptional regulator n=1 Tax=Leifsonia aquatica TaxID=144185 RepID=UPI0028AFE321|nr:MarR family transcriptional regulator [Leifsonia aquatica]
MRIGSRSAQHGRDRVAALETRASFLLSQLGLQSAQRFTAALAPLGITPNRFGVLAHLSHQEGRTQQELATALGLHRNSMVGMIDDLEGRGPVERRRHPDVHPGLDAPGRSTPH